MDDERSTVERENKENVSVLPSPGVLREMVYDLVNEYLAARGGNGGNGHMEARMTRLEVEFEYVRKDLDEIKADNKTILSELGNMRAELANLPTRSQLHWSFATMAIIAFTIVALFVGVLTYLQRLPTPS